MSINNKVTEILGIKTFESKETRPKRMYGKYQQISLPYMYLLRALNTRQLECFRQKQPTAAKKRLRAREKRVAMQKNNIKLTALRCITDVYTFVGNHLILIWIMHTHVPKNTQTQCACVL